MKLPKRISDLIRKKQAFIDKSRSNLERIVVKEQSRLLEKVLNDIIPALDVKDGVIQDTNNNYRLISSFDRIYNQFTASSAVPIEVSKSIAELTSLGDAYFKVALGDGLGTRFEKVVSQTAKKINLRVGLDGGKMVSGGFLDSVVKDNSLGLQIKDYIAKSVTGQIDSKEFIKGLSGLINGVEKEVIKEGEKVITKTGAVEKQYQRYAYDLYQQYDRAYSSSLADEFEMNYFVYQGGLIEDSRDFCVAHNNKVWSREEAADWDKWMPYMGDYPEGYTVKQKDLYEIPSYLGYPGYQPLIDAGGYRCRHAIGWISNELAEQMRKDQEGVPKEVKEPEIIEEAKKSIDELNTIDELNQYAQNELGFTKAEHGITDINTLRTTLKELELLKNSYKSDKFVYLGVEGRGGAMASGNNGGMFFNKAYFNNPEKFNKVLVNNANSRFHPRDCNTIKSIIDHEFAHTLTVNDIGWHGSIMGRKLEEAPIRKELVKIKTRYTKDLNQKINKIQGELHNAFPNVTSAQSSAHYEINYKFFTSWDKEAVVSGLKTQGATESSIKSVLKSIDDCDMIRVSEYAKKNLDEFTAECFASALNTQNPSPYAKEVFELINKTYKK